MQESSNIDKKFMDLAGPVLAEFGFSGAKELLKEQLVLMLEARISRYEAESRLFETKYGLGYEQFAGKCREEPEVFEHEDDLNNWRFALESLRRYKDKLSEVENA